VLQIVQSLLAGRVVFQGDTATPFRQAREGSDRPSAHQQNRSPSSLPSRKVRIRSGVSIFQPSRMEASRQIAKPEADRVSQRGRYQRGQSVARPTTCGPHQGTPVPTHAVRPASTEPRTSRTRVNASSYQSLSRTRSGSQPAERTLGSFKSEARTTRSRP